VKGFNVSRYLFRKSTLSFILGTTQARYIRILYGSESRHRLLFVIHSFFLVPPPFSSLSNESFGKGSSHQARHAMLDVHQDEMANGTSFGQRLTASEELLPGQTSREWFLLAGGFF